MTRILVLPRKNPGRCREEKSFESASDFRLIAAPAHKNQDLSNNRISSLSSKRGKVKIGPKTGVELKYHKRHEWNKLLEEEQNEVRKLSPNKRRKGNDSNHASKIAALKSKLDEQIQVIASLKAKPLPDIPPNPT